MVEMVNLSHADWMEYLLDLGFTEGNIQELEDSTYSLFDGSKLVRGLLPHLREVKDLDSELEMVPTLVHYVVPLLQGSAVERLLNSGYPDGAAVRVHIIRHIMHAVDSAIWLESARRRMLEGPAPDFSMSHEEIAEGIALAELGLDLDAAEWPPY